MNKSNRYNRILQQSAAACSETSRYPIRTIYLFPNYSKKCLSQNTYLIPHCGYSKLESIPKVNKYVIGDLTTHRRVSVDTLRPLYLAKSAIGARRAFAVSLTQDVQISPFNWSNRPCRHHLATIGIWGVATPFRRDVPRLTTSRSTGKCILTTEFLPFPANINRGPGRNCASNEYGRRMPRQ